MNIREKHIIKIYTDGACSGNQFDSNMGGWGVVLEYEGHKKELYGSEVNTTNNRMEIVALIEGLCALTKKNYDVWVFSDSSYLINCLRKRWYEKWQINGWLTSNKKPVENKELWERLITFLPDYEFRFFLIKGHIHEGAGDDKKMLEYDRFVKHNGDGFTYQEFLAIVEKNNRADELANTGINEARA